MAQWCKEPPGRDRFQSVRDGIIIFIQNIRVCVRACVRVCVCGEIEIYREIERDRDRER